jgi:hypothetical protein
VDALIYHGEITICGLADRHIFFPPYFIEMGHTMPTNMDKDTVAALIEVFSAGVRALGLLGENACGAAKGDIKLCSNTAGSQVSQPMVGEIAARLSGGYMSGWTYPYASGVEVTRGAIQAALGLQPQGLTPSRNWTCAERAFISIPGKVRTIRGLETAREQPGVQDLFLRAEKGSRVRFPENNVTKCGNVIAAAPSREQAVTAAETAARAILIGLEVPDPETAAFLGLPLRVQTPAGSSPPDPSPPDAWRPQDAFTLPAPMAALLAELPDPDFPADWECKAPEGPSIIPFGAFTGSSLTDYVGRSVAESLEAVRKLTGLSLPLADTAGAESAMAVSAASPGVLGRRFWAALIRGGYQGAAYLTELLTGTPRGEQ